MKTEKGNILPDSARVGTVLTLVSLTAIVVAVYEEPTTPQQAANVVEKLGEYLMGHGY